MASNSSSTVSGGGSNTASGPLSTVVGGFGNTASGSVSFAAGFAAIADRDQCFVFANWASLGSGTCLGTTNIARFLLDHGLSVDYFSRRTDGGGNRWVYIGDIINGQTIATHTGGFLSDGGQWIDNSDAATKDDFRSVDAADLLARLASLPVQTWRYRIEDHGIRHLGPTAQDFHAMFGLGLNDKSIAALDANGVALAAIQGLNTKLETKIAEQAREIAELRKLVTDLVAERSPNR